VIDGQGALLQQVLTTLVHISSKQLYISSHLFSTFIEGSLHLCITYLLVVRVDDGEAVALAAHLIHVHVGTREALSSTTDAKT
jgi:hypothetical protein